MNFMRSAGFIDANGNKMAINPEHVTSVIEYSDAGYVEIFMVGGACHAVRGQIMEVLEKLDKSKLPKSY